MLKTLTIFTCVGAAVNVGQHACVSKHRSSVYVQQDEPVMFESAASGSVQGEKRRNDSTLTSYYFQNHE